MKEQIARNLHPLVNSPDLWEPMEAYLLEQIQWTHQALGVEISELEFRRLQGKLALLETFKNLKDVVKSSLENAQIEKNKNNYV